MGAPSDQEGSYMTDAEYRAAEDFTKEGVAKLIAENDDMLDDWSASRGIITYRRQLRNERDAAHARIAELEAKVSEQASALSTAKAEAEKMREALERAAKAFQTYAASVEGHFANKYEIANDLRTQAMLAGIAIRALKEVKP